MEAPEHMLLCRVPPRTPAGGVLQSPQGTARLQDTCCPRLLSGCPRIPPPSPCSVHQGTPSKACGLPARPPHTDAGSALTVPSRPRPPFPLRPAGSPLAGGGRPLVSRRGGHLPFGHEQSNPIPRSPLRQPGPVRSCRPLARGTHSPTSTPRTQPVASLFPISQEGKLRPKELGRLLQATQHRGGCSLRV